MRELFKIGTTNVSGGSIPDPFTNPFTIRVDNANAFLVETAAGVDVFNVNTLTSQVGFADGSAAAPSGCFISDIDTGIYRTGTNGFGITTGGKLQANFLAGVATLVNDVNGQSPLRIRTTSSTGFAFVDLYSSANAKVGGFGYANAGAGATGDTTYFYTVSKAFFISTDDGATRHFQVAATSGVLSITPAALASATPAITATVATSGAGSAVRIGQSLTLSAGSTTSGVTTAGFYDNVVAGTGNTWTSDAAVYSYRPNGNFGFSGYARGTTTGINTAITGLAALGNTNIGLWGAATVTKNNAVNVGVAGFGLNAGTGTAVQIGGFFSLYNGGGSNAAPVWGTSSALVADNAATTSDIFSARDNGTKVFTIADGGFTTMTTVAATTGTPTTLSITGAAHTGMANANFADLSFNFDRNVQFAGGGSSFDYGAALYIGAPSFSAAAAQSMSVAANVILGSVAHVGNNITASFQTNLLLPADLGRSDLMATILAVPVGIETGVGNITRISAFEVSDFMGSGVELGNTTSTLGKAAGINVEAITYTSNTNTRTVTLAAGAVFNAPVAGSNVVFGDSAAVLVETGDLRMNDGRLRENRGANLTAASTLTLGDDGNSWVVTGNTTVNYITTTGWNEGSVVTLYFTGTPVITNEAGTVPADTAEILLDGSTNLDLTGTNGATIQLQYLDSKWVQVGVAVVF